KTKADKSAGNKDCASVDRLSTWQIRTQENLIHRFRRVPQIKQKKNKERGNSGACRGACAKRLLFGRQGSSVPDSNLNLCKSGRRGSVDKAFGLRFLFFPLFDIAASRLT